MFSSKLSGLAYSCTTNKGDAGINKEKYKIKRKLGQGATAKVYKVVKSKMIGSELNEMNT
jgi:hypothetical protein